MFESTIDLCSRLSATTKKNEKEAIIKTATPEDISLFKIVYNQFTTFGVTSKNCKKHNKSTPYAKGFNVLINELINRDITGHTALEACNGFAEALSTDEEKEMFWNIIDRDLKIGTGKTLINNVFPGTIKTFDVALAERYDKAILKKKSAPDFDKESWTLLRKLDGIRCIIKVEKGKATAWSRQGRQILTIDNVLSDIEEHVLNQKFKVLDGEVATVTQNFVLDGELCMVDENGDEDFQGILKLLKKKDYTIPNPKLVAFDIISLDDFTTQGVNNTSEYADRLNLLTNIVDDIKSEYISIVENLGVAKSEEDISKKLTEAVNNKWEGLILRKGPYTGKRSWDLLKVKKFYDAEYTVEKADFDKIQFVEWHSADGKIYVDPNEMTKEDRKLAKPVNAEEVMLKSVYITHKGNTVKVGSGFSIKQRMQFAIGEGNIVYDNKYYNLQKDYITNNEITVAYFEETKNINGEYSLRFPTCKAIYNGKRNM
jgi:DNA ligase-1